MHARAPCPGCGASRWVGSPPRCEACGSPLILDAVAADDDERLPELEVPPSDEVIRLAKSHRAADRTPAQRLVFGLLANTLADFRSQDRLTFAVAYAMGPVLIAAGVAAALAFMAAAYWLLALAGALALDWALYALPVLALVFARVLKSNSESSRIDLYVPEGKAIGLRLGRLRDVFHSGAAGSLPLFLGMAFGLMWGLLYFTRDHGGTAVAGGFGECFLLTLDNLCHGVFFDVCELYDLRFGRKLEHTAHSATVFNLFRLSFDALALVFLYESWQRWRLRRLFYDFPTDARDIEGVLVWVGRACADRRRLPTRYLDEVLFLVLAKEYLAGDYAFVRKLSGEFPQLPVAARVRGLFRGPGGEALFVGEYQG